jgi:hypothetical protein
LQQLRKIERKSSTSPYMETKSFLICRAAHEAPIGGQLPPHQRVEVLAMNSLRISVEWPYGDITVLFQIMHSMHHKK